MRAYSAEMRRDVLEMEIAGMTTHETALELNVSKSWVRRVKQEFRESGKTAPLVGRRRTSQWQQHAAWLTAQVAAQPDIYLRELKVLAAAELKWNVPLKTLSIALRALKLTRKKDADSGRATARRRRPPAS